MLNDSVTAAVTRLRMDLETARAALARASQRLRDLEDQSLSREQLLTFIGNHGGELPGGGGQRPRAGHRTEDLVTGRQASGRLH
jgi:hypothetical protein